MPSMYLSHHSRYFDHYGEWDKWRTVFGGGQAFIERYLEKFSERESKEVFEKRKRVTPSASFAASSIDEIRDAILNRLHLVKRVGGSDLYTKVVQGKAHGIDYHGNSMTTFMSRSVLPELLVMSRVGIYMDMPRTLPGDRGAAANITPYAYTYPREDILDWKELRDHPGRLAFVSVLDRPVDGPLSGHVVNRRMTLTTDGVLIQYFMPSEEAQPLLKLNSTPRALLNQLEIEHIQSEDIMLEGFKEIPFWVADIDRSLMQPVANHQIALMNLESSDIGFCLHANFPFYIEQFEGMSGHLNNDNTGTGTAAGAAGPGRRRIEVGGNIGRQYSTDKPPAFINPSPDPMRVSMEKQDRLKNDIRRLLHQQVTALNPKKQQSADSAEFGERPLEAGLSFIGHAMQTGENALARFWTLYRTDDKEATITYPSVWTLETDQSRHEKAEALTKLRITIPSPTFQKAVSQQIALTLLTGCVTQDEMDKIYEEIQNAPGVTADPETIALILEKGVIDLGNAAILLGVPKDAPGKAILEHEARLERIAKASQSNSPDTETDPNAAGQSRERERETATTGDAKARQRGRGKRNRTHKPQEA